MNDHVEEVRQLKEQLAWAVPLQEHLDALELAQIQITELERENTLLRVALAERDA